MDNDDIEELVGDLLRRAEAADRLADAAVTASAAAHRLRGKAAAYRHAAELVKGAADCASAVYTCKG